MVTDEMVEAGCKANFKWYLGEWITEDQRDIARQQVRTILEAALSPAEPVAWLPARRWEQMTAAEPWLTNIVYSQDQAKFFPCIPLYAAPPVPSVAVKALHQAASDFMHLFIQDGRLTMQDLEDTDLIPAYEKLSAALSAQVQDVAGTEAIAALKEAEPYVEICHSLMTQKETRANVWRVLKQVRASIAAAPAKQEGGE